MRSMTKMWVKRTAGAAGLTALAFTYACGGVQVPAAAASAVPAMQSGAPVMVSCEPNQRALVRPAAANSGGVSQVECVTFEQPVAATGFVQPAQVVARPIALETSSQPQIVPISSYPTSTVRPVRTVQTVEDRPVRRVTRTRSVTKSAVIIGSSAGVGAGLGAAIGGKKGAGIGALVGGGGAALWDQITRRK
jgi:hypothetical protein